MQRPWVYPQYRRKSGIPGTKGPASPQLQLFPCPGFVFEASEGLTLSPMWRVYRNRIGSDRTDILLPSRTEKQVKYLPSPSWGWRPSVLC